MDPWNDYPAEKRARILADLRGDSPLKEADPLDKVSDESFERLEKLCELLDDENMKPYLPDFKDINDEIEYIRNMESHLQSSSKCQSQNEYDSAMPDDFSRKSVDESCTSSQCDESDIYYPAINDTLEEVDLILAMGSEFRERELIHFSTPQYQKVPRNHFVSEIKPTWKFSSNINFRRGGYLSPIPEPFPQSPRN